MSARHPRTRSLSLVVIDARRLILLRAMATSITAIPLGRHIPQRAASSLDAPAVGRMPLLGIIRLAISVRALQAKSLLVERELIEVLPQVTCGDPREDLGWQFRSVSSALTRNALIDPLEQVRVLAEVSISFVAGSGQVFSCSSAYRLGPLGGHKVHKMVKFRPRGMVDRREMEQAQLFETADERGCTPMFGAAHRRGSACIGGSLPSAV